MARATELLDLLLEVTVLLQQDMTQALEQQGLTTSRTHLLWELQQRGPSTQQALAAAMGTSPRNVTGLVDGLVDTGFVTREPHPTDRRAVLVSFTDHGARTMTAMAQAHGRLAADLFGDLPDVPAQAVAEGLAAVRDRLAALVSAP